MIENGPQPTLENQEATQAEFLNDGRDLSDVFLPLTDWTEKNAIKDLLEAKYQGPIQALVTKILNEVAWHEIAEDQSLTDLSPEAAIQKLSSDADKKAKLYNALANALQSDFSAVVPEEQQSRAKAA